MAKFNLEFIFIVNPFIKIQFSPFFYEVDWIIYSYFIKHYQFITITFIKSSNSCFQSSSNLGEVSGLWNSSYPLFLK